MAAPMVLAASRRTTVLCSLKCFVLSANYDVKHVGCHHQRLASTATNCAQLQCRLYSQSFSGSEKPPLKKPYTPVGKHDNPAGKHRDAEKEPLEAFTDGINPVTRERGGPRGPEPTRYGDWERKGRCIDF